MEGIVQWDPPVDISQVMHYGVWVTHAKEKAGLVLRVAGLPVIPKELGKCLLPHRRKLCTLPTKVPWGTGLESRIGDVVAPDCWAWRVGGGRVSLQK